MSLELTIDGPIARVVLNRPKKLNAMGPAFWDALVPTFDAINADPAVRVAIVTAEGRAFSAGLDLMAMMPRLPTPGGAPDGSKAWRLHALIRGMQAGFTAIERCRVPVIAAVHGLCLGGGIDLITACDIRLASADAVFSVRETKMAIVADVGTLQRLPAIIGPGHTRELVYTGRDFDAAYAERIGLVNAVHPDRDSLHGAAEALAQEIAQNAPLAVQGAKQVLNEATRAEVDRGLEYVATYNVGHLFTQDLGVAMAAYVSKQPADFGGR